MKDFDISIYGHLCFDNIFDQFEYRSAVGAMGNVWLHLKKINPTLRINLVPTDIGEALVVVDRQQNKRTSVSALSMYTQYPKYFNSSTVNHVMYINQLSDLSFLQNVEGFIVADVCNGRRLNLQNEYLKRINLLLISDEDCIYSKKELLKTFKTVLLHKENGSILYVDGREKYFEAKVIKGVNVLGAGDKFAAHILAGLVEDLHSLPKIIQNAHNCLTSYFLNEKI